MATATEAPQLRFLDTTVSFPVSSSTGDDGISVMTSYARRGDSPPLHVHATEDEVFHVLEGTIRLSVGGREFVVVAGETAHAPKGVPHTYRVESEEARWRVVTTGGDFERFVRALARPVEHDGAPPAGAAPTEEERQLLAATAAEHGIELVGPPL